MAAILEEPWAADTAVLSDLGLPLWDERDDAGNEVIPGWTVDEILQQAG
jgi:hypothetical protein